MTDSNSGKIAGSNPHLQILRCIAASLVVADHAAWFPAFVAYRSARTGDLASELGHFSVDVFFVLSGYLMLRQTWDRFRTGNSTAFLPRRFVRIAPMYWIVTGLLLVLLRLQGAPYPPDFHVRLLRTLLFLPSPHAPVEPLLIVGWTLNYEFWFYVLFAVAMTLPLRYGAMGLAAVLGGLVALGFLHPASYGTSPIYEFVTAPYVLFFLVGMGICIAERELRIPMGWRPGISAALLLLPMAVVVATSPRMIPPLMWWGIRLLAATLVVLLCVVYAAPVRDRMQVLLVHLGDASYSTYLIHLLLQTPVFLLLGAILPMGRRFFGVYILVSVVAANLAGWCVYRLVERPMTRGLTRRFTRSWLVL